MGLKCGDLKCSSSIGFYKGVHNRAARPCLHPIGDSSSIHTKLWRIEKSLLFTLGLLKTRVSAYWLINVVHIVFVLRIHCGHSPGGHADEIRGSTSSKKD